MHHLDGVENARLSPFATPDCTWEVLPMSDRKITGHRSLRLSGSVTVPGDKSIAHRILILGSYARGTTFARGVPQNDDIEATMRCLAALGVQCERADDAVSVVGLGDRRYKAPAQPLDCGGSATTMRLLMGAVVARGRGAVFAGDDSLMSRPMDRVAHPMRMMGAGFQGNGDRLYPPVRVTTPENLEPMEYKLEVASGQLKTAIILAGLGVPKGRTVISGAINSRDHTERLVPQMGGSLVVTDDSIIVERSELRGLAHKVPGDVSTAAFFAAAAALLEDSRIQIRSICTNPTRMGFFEALSWMGGDVTVDESALWGREPVGDVTVRSSPLRGIEIHEDAVPFLIDEVPLVMLLGCFAEGQTIVRGVSELRIKESDRISCAVEGLTRMGADIEVGEDWVRVNGTGKLRGAELEPWGDHRMAMMFTIAAMAATGDSVVRDVDCEAKSFPEFYENIQRCLR